MLFFIVISSIIILCAGFFLLRTWLAWNKLSWQDRSPLAINTFDGLQSPYHPSVVFIPGGWNGWEYWMAETPFSMRSKPYWDRNECPSIHVSHDGIHWTEPQGLKNPIVDLNAQSVAELDYFSDVHLLLNDDNKLELWYRITRRHGDKYNCEDVTLFRTHSSDGSNWSQPETIAELSKNEPGQGLGRTVVSPALTLDEGCYNMWYVDVEKPAEGTPRGVSYSTSADGKLWEDLLAVNFNQEINPWHLDVQKIDGRYLMLVYDLKNITLWESTDRLNFNFVSKIYSPSGRFGACTYKLYRSCLLRDNEGYKIYMSGNDGIDTHICLLQGNNLQDMIMVQTDNLSFCRFALNRLFFMKRKVCFMAKHLLRK